MPDGRDLPELQEIVSSALATAAEDRYSSAEKMTKAIETFLRAHSAALPENPSFALSTQAPRFDPAGEKDPCDR